MTLLRNILIILLITILFLGHGICQKNKDSVIYFPFISISLAIQSPQGDLANNFGVNSNIGLSLGWKNKKNQTFELNYNFIHSENVKNTSVLDHLINDQGWIINQYGEENLFLMYHRGGLISLDMGKVYNIIGPNPNSGIFLKGGIGAMYHKIRIENQENLIPQLKKEYLKYYDRLTVGLLLKQYIGYQNMSNNKLVNFTIGIEAIEGFSRGMRDYQIDLMGPYTENKFDIYLGIRAGWFFPVLRKNPNEFYYN
ncbi:MAG: hypothetical protein QNK57_06220 [Flavobacteriales bacterium]